MTAGLVDPYAHLNLPVGGPTAPQWIATAFVGPSFIGYGLHFMLWGAMVNHLAHYLSTDLYQRDGPRTKAILWAVFLLDTASAWINFTSNFKYGTSQKRDADTLYMIQPLDTVPLLLLGVVACVVQVTLAVRASSVFGGRRLQRAAFLAIMFFLITFCWLGSLGSSILNLMICYGTQDRALPFTFNNLAGTYLWLAVVIDLAISTTLYAQLRSHSRIGDSLNAGLMRSLGQIALRTAIPTTVMATVGAVMSTAFPVDELRTLNAVFAIYYPLSSVYVFSLLYTLSSREALSTPRRYSDPRSIDSGSASQADPLAIEVQRTVMVSTEVDLDGLLFRSGQQRLGAEVSSGIPMEQPTKWDRERDTADW